MADHHAGDYYKVYEEHSRNLRTWLVAYGAGVPVLLLSNDKLWEKLAISAVAGSVMLFFILGIAFQAGLSALNKLLMWALYYGERDEAFKTKKRYKAAYFVSDLMWIDFMVDVVTVVLFVVATMRLANGILA